MDLDGTLADSLVVMRTAYQTFVEDFGGLPSQAEFDSLNGPPLDEVVEHLKRVHAIDAPSADLNDAYCARIDALYDEVEPSEGGMELILAAASADWNICLVTSNDRERARNWLDRVGLLSSFSAIVAGQDAVRGKPDPGPYLLALERIGCRADLSVAVEDSAPGIQSALAAGLTTYAFGRMSTAASSPDGAISLSALGELLPVLTEFRDSRTC